MRKCAIYEEEMELRANVVKNKPPPGKARCYHNLGR
jgi:hypothetical protein